MISDEKHKVKNSTFLKVALLIILAGIVYYLVVPKYTFNQDGRIRKNIYTGTVEYLDDSDHWHRFDEPWLMLKLKEAWARLRRSSDPRLSTKIVEFKVPDSDLGIIPVEKDSFIPQEYFSVGSTQEEVRKIQGTPTKIFLDTWHYDYDSVDFDGSGRVIGYSNNSGKLKVR